VSLSISTCYVYALIFFFVSGIAAVTPKNPKNPKNPKKTKKRNNMLAELADHNNAPMKTKKQRSGGSTIKPKSMK
jgi:hypothetical protein